MNKLIQLKDSADNLVFPKTYEEDWINANLINNWINAYSHYYSAQYKKINNQVFLRGLIKNKTAGSDRRSFILPIGYRPNKLVWTSCITAKKNILTLQISRSGEILMDDLYVIDDAMQLDNISFFID